MSYELHLIPTSKKNAVICEVETTFTVVDFTGSIFTYDKNKIYNLSDLKQRLMSCGAIVQMRYVQPMHLHLTDAKAFNDGDWYVDTDKYNVFKGVKYGEIFSYNKRIICTTDTDLRNDIIVETHNGIDRNIPNFHHMFIFMYIEMYNSGQAITTNVRPQRELNAFNEMKFIIDADNIMSIFVEVNKPKKTT